MDQFVRVDDAFAYFTDRIRTDPEDQFSHKVRATLSSDRKDFDRALEDWNKVVEIEPEDPSSYFGRGNIRITRKEWDKAVGDFTQTIKLDPEHADAHGARAFAWLAQHSFDQAIADCSEAIKLDPEDPRTFVIRGRAWLGKQEFDKAIADCTEAIQLDRADRATMSAAPSPGVGRRNTTMPSPITIWRSSSILWTPNPTTTAPGPGSRKGTMRGRWPITSWASGLIPSQTGRWPSQRPNRPGSPTQKTPSRNSCVHLPLEHANADDASKDADPQAQRRRPYSGLIRPDSGTEERHSTPRLPKRIEPVSVIRGDSEAALSRDTFGIPEPQTALEFVTRAGDWLRIKLYDNAIADCTRAIDLGCHDPRAHIFRGLAFSEKKEFDKSIADYNDAIPLDPQSAFAYAARANAWIAKKDYGRADADLAKALSLDPENPARVQRPRVDLGDLPRREIPRWAKRD